MCFRPAQISMKTCPGCGKTNKPVATVCEACGADLPAVEITVADGDLSNPAVANMAPSAPIAPGAPQVPKAPGVPSPRND